MNIPSGLILVMGLAVILSATAFVYRPQPTNTYGTTARFLPNKTITPGGTNLAITDGNIDETICSKNWRTGSVRDSQSTKTQKNSLYAAYGIQRPKNNVGQNQTCELDHLISLELGGSDELKNIWPECGPSGASLNERYFKKKDKVENYLHKLVCDHEMTLTHAQHQIATDWYAVYLYLQGNKDALFVSDEDQDDTE